MTYVMEQKLIEKINAQRAEAIEFSKQPGCWMGMYVEPSDTKYWSERVPSGTLKEFDRITLEEDAYYTIAEAYSKSYARSFDFSSMTDEEIETETRQRIQMDCKRWYRYTISSKPR